MENRSKKKVCCFCETWESGGIESFLNNVFLRLDSEEVQIDLVASRIGPSVFTKQLQDRGIRFIELSGTPRKVLINARLLRKLMRQEQYDVFHLNAFQALSMFYLCLAKKEKIPVRLAHSHNTALRKSTFRWAKLLVHRLSKGLFTKEATALLACSRNAANFLFGKRVLRKKGFAFIPNGIDTARFRFDPEKRETLRQKLGLSNALVVGNVGRLCYQKNQMFLLNLLEKLLKNRENAHLLLAGEGEDLKALQQEATRLGIGHRVTFYGVSKQIEELFWAMDLFVFPSRFEGLGIVAVEAQAAGLPVFLSEHVPPEAAVTALAQPRPLEEGAAAWSCGMAEVVLPENRERYAALVADAGFDIGHTARLIEALYKNEENSK